MNYDGPPVLWAHSKSLGLQTDGSWLAKGQDGWWRPALPADQRETAVLTREFPTVGQMFRDTLPYGLGLFSLGFFACLLFCRTGSGLSIRWLRWLLLGLWAGLAVDSFFKLGLYGFDLPDHLEYIIYVKEKLALPLANEGGQMFQSPLYYLVSAALLKIFRIFSDPPTALKHLVIVPLLCGMAQVEICYRCLINTFPERRDLQAVGLVAGSFLPMNLYMSQYIGNEPLAAALSAFAIMLMVTWLRNPAQAQSTSKQVLLGIALGLAILTKVTAVLLVVPIFLAGYYVLRQAGSDSKSILLAGLRITAVLLVVAGWYYARNWLLLGKPFVGGWDPSRGIRWWQDPGYRTLADFTTFGSSLAYPIYAGTRGFWDSIYSTFWLDGFMGGIISFQHRPPWNFPFVLAAPLLCLFPSMGIFLGIILPMRRFEEKTRLILTFSLACVGIYFLAIFSLYINLPIYSTGKATYSLGLVPCFAMLLAGGLSYFMKNTLSRAVVFGLTCWCFLFAYIAYFPLP